MRPRPRSLSVALGLAAGATLSFAQTPSPLTVDHLRCEGSMNPSGLESQTPKLSWWLESPVRGADDSAYQVLVAGSSEALASGHGDLWDSGEVKASGAVETRYRGKPLSAAQEVYWKVRVWDKAGTPSAWSEPGRWLMGIPKPADWHAQWIAAAGATESLLLRKEFVVKPGLRRAVVQASGLGQYELELNGKKVGKAFLTPGWTRYDKTILYDTCDVTSLLQEGTNAAGFLLGNGIYDVVRRDRYVKFKGSFGPLRALMELRLEYADGSVDTVVTDPSWRVLPGPITTGNIYSGEDWDERLVPKGWSEPGFAGQGWHAAVRLVKADERLAGFEEAADPIGFIESHPPAAEKAFPDGTIVYDLGQNASHIPKITVAGPAGSTVRFTPAEVINADGTINRSTMDGKGRGDEWWQYTKATNGEESWTPRFYYAGCRYLKAEFFAADEEPPSRGPDADSGTGPQAPEAAAVGHGARPSLTTIEGIVVHSTAPPDGTFAASNPLLGQIRDLVRWAQRSNMMSVLTDCPHREKLGWLEEDHLNGPAISYEFDASRLFSKALHDMSEAQEGSGFLPNIAPEYVRFEGAFRSAAEWGSAYILVPWQQWKFTGDRTDADLYASGMRRYVDYLGSRTKDSILSDGLGDWFDLGPKPPQGAQLTEAPLTATAFYYEDLMTLLRLRQKGASVDLSLRADAVFESFNRHFWNESKGAYGSGSQCANAIALAFGLVPEERRARVVAALVKDIEQHRGMMTTGDVGFRFLLIALAENGRSDLIYKMITQEAPLGYAFQVRHGETSLTEAWDANLNTSHDHFMLGQVEEWFYRYLVGIDYERSSAGFKHVVIAPQPVRGLSYVEGSHDGPYGTIRVRWEEQDGHFRLHVTVPPGSTGLVELPATGPTVVTEGGAPLGDVRALNVAGRQGDRDLVEVGSGSYDFLSTYAPAR